MVRKKKNPYINVTLEEVAHAEAKFFYIQVGGEIVEYNGRLTFSKEKADYLFYELQNNLVHMVSKGTDEERNTALTGLKNFRVHPLRIH